MPAVRKEPRPSNRRRMYETEDRPAPAPTPNRRKRTAPPPPPVTRAKAAKKAPTKATTPRQRSRAPRERDSLPSWTDLGFSNVKAATRTFKHRGPFDSLPTLRFALVVVLVCVAVTVYVGHGFATQQTAAELETLRRDNHRLHLQLNRMNGAFDQATGPQVVLQRAGAIGLREGFAYGPAIILSER
ncbi:hypothetical protein BH23BAC4_BH23BAC4_14690 [soil metagenome]